MYSTLKGCVTIWVVTFSVLAFSLASCDKDDDDDNNNDKVEYNLAASADGGQETPSVATNATGSLTGTYNKSTNAMSYTVTWSDLSGSPTDMHFHGPADPGTPANVAVPITGFGTDISGSYDGSATLTDAQEAELLAGKWYYNVHTDAHPAGEVRGQIAATAR